MHPHSTQAFTQHIYPSLTSKQKEVYNALRELGKGTMHQIATHMGIELNRCSGRFGELRDKKMIESIGVDRSSGSSRTIWSVKSEPKQLTMFKK